MDLLKRILTKEITRDISFSVNGKRISVNRDYAPTTCLLDFLRQSGISTGTKGCCYEGGCGICLVTVKFVDPVTKTIRSYSVNSCLLQLYSCDGLEITTVEGLGSTRSGVHPIQDRLAKYDGAQCGYCTPGQVINMYGLLKNKPTPTMKEVEDAFDTTICRCTGYRSILDAMKSFAVDAPASPRAGVIDIEELDVKICGRTGFSCHLESTNGNAPLQIFHAGVRWIKPVTLPELCGLLRDYKKDNYRLVFGNTGFGLFKELRAENFKTLIDIRDVAELYNVDLDKESHISLGANLTLTNLKELFESIDDWRVPYSRVFVRHLQYVTSTGVRNLGCWAGNLMLKRLHPAFPSDVFTMLETVGATLNIANSKGRVKNYSMLDFLTLDMAGRVIVSADLPKYRSKNTVIRTFKTSPRLQLSVAHVSSGFHFQMDTTTDYLIEERPTIIIQGIGPSLVHASQTEEFLTNRKLSDPDVVTNAIKTLSVELLKTVQSSTASPAYLVSLAVGHFYKFILGVCKDTCGHCFVSGGLDIERPVSSATHDYGTPGEAVFPATKPMTKITAPNLTTGEVKFVNDLPAVQGQAYGAVLLSCQGNAHLSKVDAAAALKVAGVVAFVQASDIPGQNNWRPASQYGDFKTEVMTSGPVTHAGQAIGVIVAESEHAAQEAVKLVSVSYTNVQPVIVDVIEAIHNKSFYTKLGPFTSGNAEDAMKSAPHRIQGNTRSREQYHFHLENQAAICTPTDLGGMEVVSTTQWLDATQETVAQVLGIPVASVNVEMQRLGGGFGSKILYNLPVAAMTAVAAQKVRRPVKIHMDLHTNMQFQGCRQGYYYEYEVGFDDDGKLLAIVASGYSDSGAEFQPECDEHTFDYVDSTYFCPNWSWSVQPCKTHKPTVTFMRSPGSAASIFAMECMIDHVATYLKKDHLDVRKINLYQNGQTMLNGAVLEHGLASQVVQQLENDINYVHRKQQVEEFNKANRWRKRGLQVMPSRYAMMYTKIKHSTTVTIYHGDASVVIAHGGVDMGQGINTKAVQVCAYKLGIPVDKIRVAKASSLMNANSSFTGGSTTSEIICLAVINCCDELNKRMAKCKASLDNPTWEQLVEKCFAESVNLTCQHWPDKVIDHYSTYTACCAEVELDVLTGQYQILQVDYVYDCGISLNPELDLGQLEGAFVMGLGLFLLESMTLDTQTGRALTDGSNTYKPPLTKDVPIKFNVKFLRNAPNPIGVLGSKAVGESSVAVGTCPMLALKRAIEAARADVGIEGWFSFHAPASVERIQQACLTDMTHYTLG